MKGVPRGLDTIHGSTKGFGNLGRDGCAHITERRDDNQRLVTIFVRHMACAGGLATDE